MLTVNVSPTLKIVRYDSIKEMPANLYQTARQYEILSAELGSTETEIDEMLSRLQSFARAGQITEFDDQINNYRLARSLTLAKFQPGQLDWCCYVYAVNDVPLTDYSEESLIAKIDEWSSMGLTQQLIEQTFADVKKNFGMN